MGYRKEGEMEKRCAALDFSNGQIKQLLALLLAICLVKEIYCKCPPDDPDTVINFLSISEENYDRNYSSITSEGKRPLGFAKAIWYYNRPDDDNPCVKISGASDRRLEVMFETHPSTRLCVKDQNSDEYCSDPGTGNLWRCLNTPGNDVFLEFLCDSQCEEADIQFWYRLVLGDLSADDPEGHWCDGRDQSEFPESLKTLPADYPLNPQTTTPRNTGFKNSASLVLSLCGLLLSICKATSV